MSALIEGGILFDERRAVSIAFVDKLTSHNHDGTNYLLDVQKSHGDVDFSESRVYTVIERKGSSAIVREVLGDVRKAILSDVATTEYQQ